MFAILPYEPAHRAMLIVQEAQRGDLAAFSQGAGTMAELGPAFTAAETDAEGRVLRVLGCAGLAENAPDYATAWAAFAEGLRPAQWAALTAAIRRVIAESGYRRIDLIVRNGNEAARRYAEHLGFREDALLMARIDAPLLDAAADVPRETPASAGAGTDFEEAA